MIFNAKGADAEPTICPSMVMMNDGGLSLTATERIAEPVAFSTAASMSYAFNEIHCGLWTHKRYLQIV